MEELLRNRLEDARGQKAAAKRKGNELMEAHQDGRIQALERVIREFYGDLDG